MSKYKTGSRRQNLFVQLEKEIEKIMPRYTREDRMGSLIFWYDEYSASLEFCPWKQDEIPWGIMGGDNIDLEKFDVFKERDNTQIYKVLSNFFDSLRSNEKFLKLPLRQGFQFIIAAFDDSASLVGEMQGGIPDDKVYMVDEAIEVVAQYVIGALAKPKPSPLQKISLNGNSATSVIEFVTDKYLEREDFTYYSYEEWDLGLSLNTVAKSGEMAFQQFCERIIKEDAFLSFPKRRLVVFYFIVSRDEYFVRVYETDSGILRELDEMKGELKLLYSTLDD